MTPRLQAAGRTDTWINESILDGYTRLHRLGFAHSLECWQGGELVGDAIEVVSSG